MTRTEYARRVAFHEAGHAVIGLAKQLPIAFVTIKPNNPHVCTAHGPSSLGYTYAHRPDKNGNRTADADFDAFGNPARKREVTDAERHARAVMCLAGGCAEGKLCAVEPWRKFVSSSDLSIARSQRNALGKRAKEWSEYEQETLTLVEKFWPMIEAVAARLLKDETISGLMVDEICQRVARRQLAGPRKQSRQERRHRRNGQISWRYFKQFPGGWRGGLLTEEVYRAMGQSLRTGVNALSRDLRRKH